MKYLLSLWLMFILTGCMNSKNLSFEQHIPNELRVTFDCRIPFDDMRFYGQYIQKNTTKTIYYVDYKNIIESRLEITATQAKWAGFSTDEYIQMLKSDGVQVVFYKKYNNIAYLKFYKHKKTFYQLINATYDTLSIAKVEPLMFEALYKSCVK